jgi:ATP-binding protein involved in chromosome partitioning
LKSYHDITHDGGSDVAGQVAGRDQKLTDRLSAVRHIVAVMSGKGGVGKSAMTVNLATALALRGLRTGIVDADINGASVVRMTGVSRALPETGDGLTPPVSKAGVKVMSIDLFLPEGRAVKWDAPSQEHAYAWRGMAEVNAIREMVADTTWGELDVLFVDLPPGTDKLPNLHDIIDRISAAVVVSIPSPASRYVVRKSIDLAREVIGSRPICLVDNMASFECTDCGSVHALYAAPDDHLEGTIKLGDVPFDPSFGALLDAGRPEEALSGNGPAARGVSRIADQLLPVLEATIQPMPQ